MLRGDSQKSARAPSKENEIQTSRPWRSKTKTIETNNCSMGKWRRGTGMEGPGQWFCTGIGQANYTQGWPFPPASFYCCIVASHPKTSGLEQFILTFLCIYWAVPPLVSSGVTHVAKFTWIQDDLTHVLDSRVRLTLRRAVGCRGLSCAPLVL